MAEAITGISKHAQFITTMSCAVLNQGHFGSEGSLSSLRNLLDAGVSPTCCMPATIFASVNLSTVYSMQPFTITTRSTLIDFPTFIFSVLWA